MTTRIGRFGAVAVATALCLATTAQAQQTPPPADTLGRPAIAVPASDSVRADSLRRLARLDAERDALTARAPDPLAPRTVPARLPARALGDAALVDALDARGTWALRTDAPGVVAGLVRWGLDPAAATLSGGDGPALHGAQSMATGGARWDVVPLSSLDRIAWQGATLVAVRRVFDAPRPLTEIRYVTSGPEQRVEATHAQARRRRLFGADGIARAAVSYAGRAGDGPAANQRLGRGRTLDARLGFDTGRTRADFALTHHRATFGASGGVAPPDPADPYSLFDRLRATPIDGASTRRSVGTSATLDLRRGTARLALGGDLEWLRHQPGTPTAALDTTEGRVRRLRGHVALPLGPVAFATDAALDLGAGAFSSTVLSASPRVATSVGSASRRLSLAAGADMQNGDVLPAGRVDGALRIGPVEATAEASQALASVSMARRDGFGPWLGSGADPAIRVRLVRAGLAVGRRAGLRASVDAFASETSGWTAFAAPGGFVADTVSTATQRAGGLVVAVGLREGARRGLYGAACAQATADDVPGVPPLHGDVRAGVRALLFRGDLDADAFVRLRGWTAFTGRVLHEPTGLFLLPADPAAARVRAGTQLDLVARAHVRTATLHLAYVDALAGTVVTRGSLTVPGYPFAGRRLEVAVFWPIFD